MQVTEVTIHPTNEGLVKAYVSIVFDNCFMGARNQSDQKPHGTFCLDACQEAARRHPQQLANPANAETRMMIQRVILAEYEKWIREYFGVTTTKLV